MFLCSDIWVDSIIDGVLLISPCYWFTLVIYLTSVTLSGDATGRKLLATKLPCILLWWLLSLKFLIIFLRFEYQRITFLSRLCAVPFHC